MFLTSYESFNSFEDLTAKLGGKGAGLVWMKDKGITVPPFMILPTSVWGQYEKDPKGTMAKIEAQMPLVFKYFTNIFGYMPLLSVRSGAPVSCPGMMDTILNVGIDPLTREFWKDKLGDQCLEDSLKRLVVMYGSVVKGVDRAVLEDGDASEALSRYSREVKEEFPKAVDQVLGAIEAVFKSWDNGRAVVYRGLHGIPRHIGTAVTLQAMVFGNLNKQSGSGTLFTRNPDTGENEVVGEFLPQGQGEDLVAGIKAAPDLKSMLQSHPKVAQEVLNLAETIESLKGDVQDVEFTVQDGVLYLLQTRTAMRSAKAAVKIALDMLDSKQIDFSEARKRVTARTLDLADLPVVSPDFKVPAIFKGISGCSGIATGRPVFTSAEAVEARANGEKVILITKETTPEDIAGMVAAEGVLTMEGGSTSHAAVVARGMNKVCVVGLKKPLTKFKLKSVKVVSLNGSTGEVWLQDVPVVGGLNPDVEEFLKLLVGQGSVIVTKPPAHRVERLVLDLSKNILLSDDKIKALILQCRDKCDVLTVAVSHLPVVTWVSVFLNAGVMLARLEDVRLLVEEFVDPQSGKPYVDKVTGWESKVLSSVEYKVINSLEDLVTIEATNTMILFPAKMEGSKSVEKVVAWLKNDGKALSLLGKAQGIASLPVHING